MIEFIKKRGLVFWFSAAAAVLTIVGMIVMLISNGIHGYTMRNVGLFAAVSIVAILILAASEILAIKYGDKPWLTAFTAVAVALICLVLGFVLLNRVDVASAVWTWDAGNKQAESAQYWCDKCSFLPHRRYSDNCISFFQASRKNIKFFQIFNKCKSVCPNKHLSAFHNV